MTSAARSYALTPQGLERIERALFVHTKTQNALLSSLSDAQRAQLESLLREMLLTFPSEEPGNPLQRVDNKVHD